MSPGSMQSMRWESEANNLRRVLPFGFSFRHPEIQAVLLHENSEHRYQVCKFVHQKIPEVLLIYNSLSRVADLKSHPLRPFNSLTKYLWPQR